MKTRGSAGFTLIEMLVVVAIIGILASMTVGMYSKNIRRASEAVLKENLFVVRAQINTYFADKGKYPSDLAALVEDKYIRAMPYDPIAKRSDAWILVQAQMDDRDISQEPGIEDIRSGAEGVSAGGIPYSEF